MSYKGYVGEIKISDYIDIDNENNQLFRCGDDWICDKCNGELYTVEKNDEQK